MNMSGQDILGSKMPTFPKAPGARQNAQGYGANGFSGASSLLPHEKVDRAAVMTGIVQPDPDAKSLLNFQTRTVSAKPLKAANAGAAKGAKVPSVTKRRDKAGNVRPTR
jgi:hypothetical protein